MKRLLLVVGAGVLLAACAPAVEAPVGGEDRVCKWVRESVANGSLPLHLAEGWYPWCGPFEVKP